MMPLLFAMLLAALAALAQTSVATYHNDNARTGQYLDEILLSPSNVKPGLFGKRFVLPTDGAVYAQPLYLSRVKIAGKGYRNVLFVATAHDSLYAFDADDESVTNAQPLWKVSFLDPSHGVTTVSQNDVHCAVIPELGITGTPVIDVRAGAIYLIAETKEPGNKIVFRLHSIDVRTGVERPDSPVEISPPGFVPLSQKQRAALLLSNGIIYSSWSGHCDLGAYHGWVMAHDAVSLTLLGVFNDTPNGWGGSFWNGGAGPAADAEGNVYVVSANGDSSGYDQSVLKLAPPRISPVDFFTPFNKQTLNYFDLDLGSSGVLLLPDEAASPAHPHLLFTSGKEGRMYLLDRQDLGGVQVGSDSKAVASLPVLSSHATFGMAAYFNRSIYIAPENSPMLSFSIAGASLASSPSAKTPNTVLIHGATPSISSTGNKNGIVWIITVDDGGALRAYDAADLTQLFYSNAQSADSLHIYAEFAVPTIADGKVFVGTYPGVAIFARLEAHPPAIAAVTNAASYQPDAVSPGSLLSLFGSNLAPITAQAATNPLPLSLADVSVTINGVVAPVSFVSPVQINVQVPFEIPVGPATVLVRVGGTLSQPMSITVRPAAPGLFTDGHGQAAAINADGFRNSLQHPALPGTLLSLFFTGQGPVAASVEDGAAPPAGVAIYATSRISATIGGIPAEVHFAGLAPLLPGVAQINLRVPSIATGIYPVVINIAGRASNSANMAISAH